MHKTFFRELAIALLDDKDGIASDAYDKLVDYANEQQFNALDIFEAVRGANGRYFLPEDHGIIP